MSEKMEKEITKLIAEVIEIPEANIKPDADFANDLDVDSMKAIEIVAVIEKKLKIVIPEKEIAKLRNLAQILTLVKNLKNT